MADIIIFGKSAMFTLKLEITHLKVPYLNIKWDTQGTANTNILIHGFRQSVPKVLRKMQNYHKRNCHIPKTAHELLPPPPPGTMLSQLFPAVRLHGKYCTYNIETGGRGEEHMNIINFMLI